MQKMLFTFVTGLNDQYTKKQELSIKEARRIISDRILQNFGGATLTNCKGIYKHNDASKKIVFENSIKVEILATMDDKFQVLEIVKYCKEALNQECIAYFETPLFYDFI